jgi:hypothetical protein
MQHRVGNVQDLLLNSALLRPCSILYFVPLAYPEQKDGLEQLLTIDGLRGVTGSCNIIEMRVTLLIVAFALFIYLWLYNPCGPLSLFQFINLYTVGRTSWTADQPVAKPPPTHRTTQAQNKRTQTSMPQVGFEPTIPVVDRAKTVHALDRAATVVAFLPTNSHNARPCSEESEALHLSKSARKHFQELFRNIFHLNSISE